MTEVLKRNSYAGRKFHFLLVLNSDAKGVTHSGGSKSQYVPVVCDCGTEKFVQASSLKSGDVISCGCELGKAHKRASLVGCNKAHGGTGTKTYSIWKGMRKRCSNKNEPAYLYYGGRGIEVCERWSLFANFLEDMGECPPKGSIERIDVNGNYEPSNCVWIPKADQALNRNYNKIVMLDGQPRLFSHAPAEVGVTKSAGNGYRVKHGLSHQETLQHYAGRAKL